MEKNVEVRVTSDQPKQRGGIFGLAPRRNTDPEHEYDVHGDNTTDAGEQRNAKNKRKRRRRSRPEGG